MNPNDITPEVRDDSADAWVREAVIVCYGEDEVTLSGNADHSIGFEYSIFITGTDDDPDSKQEDGFAIEAGHAWRLGQELQRIAIAQGYVPPTA